MDKNVKLFNASSLALSAAKELVGLGGDLEDVRNGLLDTAKFLLDQVQIDEEENEKAEQYERIIKEGLEDERTAID